MATTTWAPTTESLTALAPVILETSYEGTTYHYTFYLLACATLWLAANYILNKPKNSYLDSDETPKSSSIENLQKRKDSLNKLKNSLLSGRNTTIQDEINKIEKENSTLKKRLELQRRLAPIRMAKNELCIGDYDMIISQRREYLTKILRLYKSAKENKVLKNKVDCCKYDQIKAINNIIGLKNLLDVMRGVELEHQSNRLKEDTFEAKMHAEFLEEQIQLFDQLTKEFIRYYEEASEGIEWEKSIEASQKEIYDKLKEELTDIKKISIDEWNRKISDKMADAYKFYRNYINDYYKVQSYIVE